MSEKTGKEDLMNQDAEVAESSAADAQEIDLKDAPSTFRLVATLAIAGALAGLLIVMVNLHTKPIIDKYKAEQLQLAVYEVLPGV